MKDFIVVHDVISTEGVTAGYLIPIREITYVKSGGSSSYPSSKSKFVTDNLSLDTTETIEEIQQLIEQAQNPKKKK